MTTSMVKKNFRRVKKANIFYDFEDKMDRGSREKKAL
jgi:hypothetical protein